MQAVIPAFAPLVTPAHLVNSFYPAVRVHAGTLRYALMSGMTPLAIPVTFAKILVSQLVLCLQLLGNSEMVLLPISCLFI